MILLDTTVLSNFARMERSDLLRLALPEAATTPQVMVELQEGVAAGHLPDCDWQWITVVTLTSEEEENLARVRLILDNGEASCIAVALARGGTLFSDDRDARRYVRRCGLRVSGTLGVLSLLVEREHLTVAEADAYLQKMISSIKVIDRRSDLWPILEAPKSRGRFPAPDRAALQHLHRHDAGAAILRKSQAERVNCRMAQP